MAGAGAAPAGSGTAPGAIDPRLLGSESCWGNGRNGICGTSTCADGAFAEAPGTADGTCGDVAGACGAVNGNPGMPAVGADADGPPASRAQRPAAR